MRRGRAPSSYGLVCLELEAADSGWRTFVSVQGSLAMAAIAKFGSEEQKQRVAAGDGAGGSASDASPSPSRPAAATPPACSRTARRDGADWIIDGAKRWIGLASIADVAVVWAQTEEGVRGFLVPTEHRRASPRPRSTRKLSMRASIQCDIDLDAVRVPASRHAARARAGCPARSAASNEARYGIVWGAMGAARACLEAALARSTSTARCSASRSARTSSSRRSSPTCSSSTRRACCSPCTSAG